MWYFFVTEKWEKIWKKDVEKCGLLQKSADYTAGMRKNARYDTIFCMRAIKNSHVILAKIFIVCTWGGISIWEI
mgnify:CR=1 FL=1